ncbi:hypothetical protein KIN20_018753 [Parelaphostrongylus tenuis]|uniref:Uncharacterized protein n=1 Tax=Parelaphostrongylus tenuis TaxID=148309 RepID=A0AAD5MJW4_PARTN|nr:hypothetical protein KIN20_018753 [Parelaphostrongylus tenuis]
MKELHDQQHQKKMLESERSNLKEKLSDIEPEKLVQKNMLLVMLRARETQSVKDEGRGEEQTESASGPQRLSIRAGYANSEIN